jgi:lipid-binding SYLF domain-containing protein
MKDQAKEAGTKAGAEKDKAIARLDDSAAVLHELLAANDKGIPTEVFDKARCVAVVPSMVKGGFIFGAEHGRGVATCRTANGWSAPAFFTMTGGTWGAQIGGQATDLVMLIMNDNGMNQLLRSKFKVGGDVSAAAGPVGRDASASTDWKMHSEVLTYSRSRGLFAGATLNGTAVKEDENANTAYYGRNVGFRPILTGEVKAPGNADKFLATVRQAHAESAASH